VSRSRFAVNEIALLEVPYSGERRLRLMRYSTSASSCHHNGFLMKRQTKDHEDVEGIIFLCPLFFCSLTRSDEK
jgi:hypothetical protein